MSGCNAPIASVFASACVAGRPVCTVVTIDALLVIGCPVTDADASHAPASCCPSVDTIATVDGICPAKVAAPVDGRHAWAMLFFGASAKGSLNLPALQGIRT
jgi:hypothetical protein